MIKQLKNAVLQNKYYSGVGFLVGTTAIGQLMLIVVMPVLTRLYSPSDLGRYGLFYSFISVASVISCLQYESAIIAEENKKEAFDLVILSFFLLVISSFLYSGVYFLLLLFHYFGFGVMPKITSIAMFFAIFITGGYNICRYFLLRENSYTVIGKVTLLQNGVRALTQTIFGFVSLISGLIFGDLIGRGAGVFRMGRIIVSSMRASNFKSNRKNLISVFKRHKAFPLFSCPSVIINSLAFSFPVLFINHYYGIASAGLYVLVNRTLNLPAGLLTRNIADVFQSQLADYSRNNPAMVKHRFWETAKHLSYMSLPFVFLTVLIAPKLFGVIFGAKWQNAGMLAIALIPWIAAQFIVSPLTRLVFVIGGLSRIVLYDISALIAVTGGFFLGQCVGLKFIETIALVSALNVLAYIFCFFILTRVVYRFCNNSIS